MGDWEKYIEILLSEKKKKDFYSHLSMEVITDVDYITCTQKEFVNNLKSEISGIIMIYFLKAIHYC